MSPFLVSKFSRASLSNLVKECFGSDFPDIIKKKQITYIYNYLSDLKAQTIVLESDYVDKDYLEDYSKYYVKCFNRYGERCARLHFFDMEFDHSDLDCILSNAINSDSSKCLAEAYLGFIVIKPIPKTFIGKTCLKTYKSFEDNPEKKILSRKYKANLYGINLCVKTIAFQEQDKILSACATTAIWVTLHAIKSKNIRDIPSSSEITLAAINHIENSSNSFPNDGLKNKQILRALDTERLRHNLISISQFNTTEKNEIFQEIKSYIDSNVPIIMGAQVFKETKEGIKEIGGHAVTILGYKQKANEEVLYLHDDRLGPYIRARIIRTNNPELPFFSEDKRSDWCVVLQEKDENGKWFPINQVLIPDSLIIPVDKKVRIRSIYIIRTCKSIVDEFEADLDELIQDNLDFSPYRNALTYEVKLEQLNDLRNRLFISNNIENRLNSLTKSSARFLWVATFYFQGDPAFEILFDATDIPQGDLISNIVIHDDESYQIAVARIHNMIKNGYHHYDPDSETFFGALFNYLKPSNEDYESYLDKKFGSLRAPKYLNKEEVEHDSLHTQETIIKRYGASSSSFKDSLINIGLEKNKKLIWAISFDGALLIGNEVEGSNMGHPTLTGFKSARIAGELIKEKGRNWKINSKSGRYSGTYENPNELLDNSVHKFQEIFPKDAKLFTASHYNPDT